MFVNTVNIYHYSVVTVPTTAFRIIKHSNLLRLRFRRIITVDVLSSPLIPPNQDSVTAAVSDESAWYIGIAAFHYSHWQLVDLWFMIYGQEVAMKLFALNRVLNFQGVTSRFWLSFFSTENDLVLMWRMLSFPFLEFKIAYFISFVNSFSQRC